MPEVQTLERDVDLVLSLGKWFFLYSNSGKPSLMGSDTLKLRTVTSCIINTVSQSFSGIQARRARTPPISSRRLVEGSMRLFFKKPAITSPTSPISSLRTLATRTSPSCSTKTPSSLTLWFLLSRKTPHAKALPAHRPRSAASPFTLWHKDGHILLCTHPQRRG